MSFQQQKAVSIPLDNFDKLPNSAGVYILKNGEETPVYIGKATSIKSRVMSHLRPKPGDPIGSSLRDQIVGADYIATQTPIEALILENVLIKKWKPRYNIRLKDDKSYPYIKITNEIYPRVFVTRQVADDGSKYFGPYGNVRAAKRTVKYLRTLFPIRSCTLPLDGVKKFRSCLDYNLGFCKAPCIFAVSIKEYQSDVGRFQLFLQGKLVEVSRQMYSDMWKASKVQDFERASKVRDQIRSLETTALRQRIVFPGQKRDKDVLTIAIEGKIVAAIAFHVREGVVVGRDKFILEGTVLSTSDSEILSAFIKQYYGSFNAQTAEMPEEIIVPSELEDKEEIELLLNSGHNGNRGNRQIKITTARTPQNTSLLKLAQENATMVLKEEESKTDLKKMERLRALKELKEILNLDRIPRRIECFDISNLEGNEAVGAMTVFINGSPAKSEYRKFKIKTVEGIDDYSMMQEMIGRRFRRLKSAKQDEKFGEPPNLVVIDGGKGQLSAALEQMHRDGTFGIPTISLAKKEELIFVPRKVFPIKLGTDSEALHILQHVRDEAHRFGIAYHRKLRGRKITESLLDSVEGVGEKRKRELLSHFGSIDSIKRSTPEEIAQAGKMSKKLAEVVLATLNK